MNAEKAKLKVCGMRDAENIMQLAALKPEYIGLIFYTKSPRYVGENFALPPTFPSSIKKVGVFVNEPTSAIIKIVADLDLQAVQLHGDESVTQCKELRKLGIEVIKVFSIGEDFDFEVTKVHEDVVDYFLFDTKGKYYGGNAKTFDWSILQKYHGRVPYFLSGGISPDNVSGIDALIDSNLYAVDVNSGAEVSPGLKDISKIKDIKNILNS